MKQDSNLIFTLRGISQAAAAAVDDRRNNRFHVAPPLLETAVASRESTPTTNAGGKDNTRGKDDAGGPQLRFTFDQRPKNIQDGFVFGSNPETCDVLIGTSVGGISGSHFRITFDDHKRLVLIDLSTHGTAVSYDGHARDEKRKNPTGRTRNGTRNRTRDKSNDFTWILFPEIKNKRVVIGEQMDDFLNATFIEFSVEVVNHEEDVDNEHKSLPVQYTQLRDAYLDEMRAAIPFGLNIDSQLTTAGQTESHSPTQREKQRPIWIDRERIGSGEFGTVYRAVNVSTGVIYAAKMLLRNSKNYRERWDKEVGLLRNISHDYIVKFVDYEPKREWPRLIMEYLPLGNLAEQNATSRITEWESVTVLCQGLDALTYLHSRKIVHRDLKPENILVQCREPTNFTIKIADFGLAKDDSFLKTLCGTYLYAAPEIWTGRPYTAKVDVWSLGLIVFQYVYGFPEVPKAYGQFDSRSWYQRLACAIDGWDSDGLLDFLSSSMLKEDPLERLPASDCLRESAALRENITPTQNLETDFGTPTEKLPSSAFMEAFRAAKSKDGRRTTTEEAKTEVEFHHRDKGDPRMAVEEMGASCDFPPLSALKSCQQPGECTDTITQIWNSVPDKKCRSKEAERSQQCLESNEESVSHTGRLKRQRVDEFGADLLANPQACKETSAYIKMKLEGKPVSMRKSDCWLDATQLMVLAGKTAEERKRIQRILNKNTRVEISAGQWWISYQDGQFLCDFLQITKRVLPLLRRAPEQGTHFDNQMNYFLGFKFMEVTAGTATTSIRMADFWINATHILKAAGHNRRAAAVRLRALEKKAIVPEPAAFQGTYVDPLTGLNLCKEYGLSNLESILRETLEQLKSPRRISN